MAKQRSIVKLEGTIGDITFVRTQDGYLAKERTSINGKRIASDPSFQRTRENNAEFGRAGKAGKVLRSAFRLQMQQAQDGRVVSRLLKQMMKVVKADAKSARGERNVINGQMAFLEGFECNIHSTLGGTLFTQYTSSIDRATGKVKISIPAFVPVTEIVAPLGTTHFKVISAASEVDFENEVFNTVAADSGIMPWDTAEVPATVMVNDLAPASTHPLFLVLGLQFFQVVNGIAYPLKNGTFNPLSIISIDHQ